MVLHLGVFTLDKDSKHQTFWHSLMPKTRLLCVLLLILAIGLTPNGSWLAWGIYSIGILIVLLMSQLSYATLVRRLAIEFSFVGVVLVGTLFRGGGQVLWQWGLLTITTNGLTVLGSVSAKAFLSLLLLNLLTLTTPVPALLQALAALKMPPLLVAILSSMYRYLAVLTEEFSAMRRAALSRNLMNSRRWQRLIVGNMFGSLFIRTLERGERVHQAMLSRGYTGTPRGIETSRSRQRDHLAIALTAVFAVLGQTMAQLR
jgi:cobalt/nickel transport system permease protein